MAHWSPRSEVDKISVFPSDYGLQQLEREVPKMHSTTKLSKRKLRKSVAFRIWIKPVGPAKVEPNHLYNNLTLLLSTSLRICFMFSHVFTFCGAQLSGQRRTTLGCQSSRLGWRWGSTTGSIESGWRSWKLTMHFLMEIQCEFGVWQVTKGRRGCWCFFFQLCELMWCSWVTYDQWILMVWVSHW